MSDSTAALPASLEPWAPSPGALEFVNQGIIRMHFPTEKPGEEKVVRVRRPFLGELKELRLELDQIRDDLGQMAIEITAEGEELKAESSALSEQLGKEEITKDEHAVAIADIRRRDRAAAQRIETAREEATLTWWEHIFSVLALDPVPEPMLWPAWILDGRLAQLVLNHWRNIPSGPG